MCVIQFSLVYIGPRIRFVDIVQEFPGCGVPLGILIVIFVYCFNDKTLLNAEFAYFVPVST